MATTQQLTEAQDARHALLTGKALVSVNAPNGRVLQFAKAELNALETYIAELKRELGLAPQRRRRYHLVPMG